MAAVDTYPDPPGGASTKRSPSRPLPRHRAYRTPRRVLHQRRDQGDDNRHRNQTPTASASTTTKETRGSPDSMLCPSSLPKPRRRRPETKTCQGCRSIHAGGTLMAQSTPLPGGSRRPAASWELALRSSGKSPQTVKAYGDGVRTFLRWCETSGHSCPGPRPDETVRRRTAGIRRQAATARSRQLAMRRFSAWLERKAKSTTTPAGSEGAPKLDQKVTDSLTDDELKALIKACGGKDFRDRRDEAIVRLMAETGDAPGELGRPGSRLSGLEPRSGHRHPRERLPGRIAPFGPRPGAPRTATCVHGALIASLRPAAGLRDRGSNCPTTGCTRR